MTVSRRPASEREEWLQIAPIFNFSSSIDIFDLDRLQIRRLTSEEKEIVSRAARQLSFTMFAEMSAADFGICASEFKTEAEPFKMDYRSDDFVTALRMAAAGAVYINLFYSWPRDRPEASSLRTPLRPFAVGEPYHLDESDLPLVSQLFTALPSGIEAKKGLGRAAQRFNLAYQRPQPEDKLIDFWIALEGLFLTGKNIGELRFRAALRIALYVGESPEERWTIYGDMKQSYDVRSRVVHGERVKKEEVDSTAAWTEEVLRRALRNVILDPKSLNPQTLDRHAVEGIRKGRSP